MSHFYARISQSARKTIPTACGTKRTGVAVQAASWEGAIETHIYWDENLECGVFEVRMIQWKGKGDHKVLAWGRVGCAKSVITP